MELFDLVLRAVPFAAPAAPDWWRGTAGVRAAFASSVERAIALGAHADRFGFAFLGGYASAVSALDPALSADELAALCATEAGGAHPRAIRTSLVNGRLNGSKFFVSGGSYATALLVVAKAGEREGRPQLVLARVRPGADGVTVEDGPALDFVPEIPHGSVTFADAPVEAVLEGDGYDRYLKPFRTTEDLHVFGALLGCLAANARAVLPHEQVEQLLGMLAAIAHLGRQDPRAPSVHLALAGVLSSSRTLLDAVDLAALEPGFRARFERDRPLLRVAQRARDQRRERAWSAFSAPS